MKSVGTINEILDLFYNRVDDISIHTKHTVANGKYDYELKDGILYCRGKQIGVCNKFVPFVNRHSHQTTAKSAGSRPEYICEAVS